MVDGLSTKQRTVLSFWLKSKAGETTEVVSLARLIARQSEFSAKSLCQTNVEMKHDFVGSNNLNVLLPLGEFGTRSYGGWDYGDTEFIHTKLSPLTRLIFHPLDDALLDNEPVWYIPVIPMILVNGCENYPSIIPKHDPRKIQGDEPGVLHPWYKNFTGGISPGSPPGEV